MANILEKIHKVGLKFLVPLTPEETYKLIADEAMKLVKADYGSILLEQQGELKRVYASSPMFYKIKPLKRDYMYRVLKTQKPIILNIKQIGRNHPAVKETNLQSDIVLPLTNRNKAIGVLTIMSLQDKHFTLREMTILKLFVPVAGLAIRKAQLDDEVKRALETRDLFISMAAHELRTPITTISGYSQLLYSKFAGSNTPESRWIEDLSWEGLRLTYLINELLEIDRIKAGQLKYIWKESSLKVIIKRALADFRFTHPIHKVVFENKLGTGSDIVIGDFDKLLQVTINLLDNAAKFSSSDKEIILSLRAKAPYIIFEVRDQGHGISKTDLPKIFERFYRGDTHTIEGMGLGLFLVKTIIMQHKGTINIKSKENRGTTVEVKLPRAKMSTMVIP